jgi:hypothetical protein
VIFIIIVLSSTIRAVGTNIEGCNFFSSNMFDIQSNNSSNHIVNSTITGRVDITRTAIHLMALM